MNIKRIRKAVAPVARLALGAALLYLVFKRMHLPDFRAVLFGCLERWPWLITGIVMAGMALLLGVVRWRIILQARGLYLSWCRLLSIYLIGQFFNSFMLGMVGGDLVRAFYTSRAGNCRKTEAMATVLVDRLSGMLVIYLVALFVMIVNLRLFLSRWELHLPAMMMLILIACSTIFIVVVYNAHRFKQWPIFNYVRQRPGMERVFANLLDVFMMFARKPRLILKTSLLSLLGQAFLICQCYCLGRSLAIPLGISGYIAVIPLILSLAAIPITPGGLGVREALSVTMLGALGVARESALSVSLLVYGVALVWSALGGLVFIGYSSGAGRTLRDETAKLREEVAREAGEFGITGA